MPAHSPTRDELVDAVAAAVLAPSIHNSQPWLFRLTDNAIEVHGDWRRRLPASDPTGRSLRVSCGAAVFNLRLALHVGGYLPEVRLGTGPQDALAEVRVAGRQPPTAAQSHLYDAIAQRRSNRYPFLDTDVAAPVRAALIDAAQQEDAWLSLVHGPVALDVVVELVRMADRALLADPAYREELRQWSRADADSPDGVSGLAGGPAPRDDDLLARRDFGGSTGTPGQRYEAEPLVAVLGSHEDTPAADVAAGQALQRVLLTATTYGLDASLTSQPIDVAPIREQLRIGLHRSGPPQLVLRLGHGLPGPRSSRRPVTEVIADTQPLPSPWSPDQPVGAAPG